METHWSSYGIPVSLGFFGAAGGAFLAAWLLENRIKLVLKLGKMLLIAGVGVGLLVPQVGVGAIIPRDNLLLSLWFFLMTGLDSTATLMLARFLFSKNHDKFRPEWLDTVRGAWIPLIWSAFHYRLDTLGSHIQALPILAFLIAAVWFLSIKYILAHPDPNTKLA